MTLGPACHRVTQLWDETTADFLAGGSPVPRGCDAWASSYRGRGRGGVVWDAFAEPYLGPLESRPAGVFLALNPGRAHEDFQFRDGVFADEIRAAGSYSSWAGSWPYLRDPWTAAKGSNRHHISRLRFLRIWHDDAKLDRAAMVGFELYPWHSTAITAVMRPDPAILRQWVWEPVAELGAPVFAFGAPWFSLLEDLGLTLVTLLGAGGTPFGSTVSSRTVAIYEDQATGVIVIAERHLGSAGPPSRDETLRLKDATLRWTS